MGDVKLTGEQTATATREIEDAGVHDLVTGLPPLEAVYRPGLPPLPQKMRGLKLDRRGYPVPFFVPWSDESGENELPDGEGVPQVHMMSEPKRARCLNEHRCWLCGGKMGRFSAYVVGPMCLVNMTSAEPPSHRECAEYAVIACPFLTKPHARRRQNGPEGVDAPGIPIERNPGVTILLVSKGRPQRINDGKGGYLLHIPPPAETPTAWCEARPATREEFAAAVESGLPALEASCQDEKELAELHRLRNRVLALYSPVE